MRERLKREMERLREVGDYRTAYVQGGRKISVWLHNDIYPFGIRVSPFVGLQELLTWLAKYTPTGAGREP